MKIEGNVSYHESINEMYKKVKSEEVTNIVDRFNLQEKTRCPYCTKGLSCQLCSMGPCRISDKNPHGACGIDAAGMVMRNFVHKNMLGTEAYTYHAVEAAKTLKATAEGKTPFEIKDVDKLKFFASKLGIEGGDVNEIAKKVADYVIADLSSVEQSKLVEIFAPDKRKELWKDLGIFPNGVFHEVLTVGSSSMTNVDSNYVSLAKKSMAMSIATCMSAQIALEFIQDILFGTPKPHESFADLGILDPDYVNIAVDGHEPFVGAALIKLAESEEIQNKAKEAGAKGLRIIGFIETGQELIQRFDSPVFAGIVGNWIVQEFALATGCVDVFAADMNCALPTIPEYQRYGVKIVPVSKLVRFRGIDEGLDYEPEKVEEIARKLIDMAIDNFKQRDKSKAVRIEKKQKIVVGFSPEAILEAVGEIEVLLDAIKSGAIKGIVALVSCTTLKNGPHDLNTVTIAKELIKRDILVLSLGCGNAALQVAGLTSMDAVSEAGENLKAVCEKLNIPPVLSFGTCTDTGRAAYLLRVVADALGVDIPQLPVAVTAPEYMEQKATIDAVFAVAYGLVTHVSPVPPVTGSADVVKLLTEDIEKVTGGKIVVEEDPVKAAEILEKEIVKKREALGI
ncbi:carbon-monoxide dehydrogenase, catalytic subunit [Archaeoglobus sulfaticallidus PM70-1]|uniref:anaerobic carbon-monoxide dehydrogenase n=1 Tax=Archaeoglobus sulfaticallidus PM70-1 TaxID=387631 RepID=N0BFZ6_9EURY|nr:anaerobic carbon-monoxide dehydrogenase catalytic subunit [Archaeoglobus sulfaticallidus]AGK61227.1 carbon-monoxide dehydrogenase, catalytic subunit [Archaeoglobus sulfaticallidus PM70-1]